MRLMNKFLLVVASIFIFNLCGASGNMTVTMDSTDSSAAKSDAERKLSSADLSNIKSIMVTITEVNVKKKNSDDAKADAEDGEDESGNKVDKNGWVTIMSEATEVDLAAILSSGNTVELFNTELEDGEYGEVRIVVSEGENEIVFNDDTTATLRIPSGTSSGIKLKTSFTVDSSNETEIILDFDASESITMESADAYKLSPVIRVSKVTDGS